MSIDHFRRYDLNLLLFLHVLLEERSVTAAGRRLGLTQSAVSRALRRLRDQLDDELLVRTGEGMVPTPRALGMKEPLENLLHGLGLLLDFPDGVEPETLERVFRIAASDYATLVVVPSIVATLTRRAPGVDVILEPVSDQTTRRMLSGEVDLAITPRHRAAAGLVWTGVLEDPWVTIVRHDHPRLRQRLTMDLFLAAEHVGIACEQAFVDSVVDEHLARHGQAREVRVRVSSFGAALRVVRRTDLLATVPRGVVRADEWVHGLASFDPPLPIPSAPLDMGWHERVRRDPVHAWLRAQVLDGIRRRDDLGA